MKKELMLAAILLLFLSLGFFGGLPEATASAKAESAQKWDTTLAEARKEGAVSLYTLWRPDTRVTLTKAFKQKYGLNLEITPFSRGSDLLAKVKAEQAAGLFLADIFGAGGPTLVSTMKPAGVLGPVEPLLILPEVKDPKVWSGGKLPFMDKDKLAIALIASKQPYIAYNTELIKKGEITTYKDLLKPQYKGKITLNDPSVTGVGNAFLSHLALHIWNLEEAKQFLTQLIREQGVVIQRDNRMHVETVARGKFAIALAPNPDNLASFLDLKAPVGVVQVKEGAFVTPAAGAFALPAKLAHPTYVRGTRLLPRFRPEVLGGLRPGSRTRTHCRGKPTVRQTGLARLAPLRSPRCPRRRGFPLLGWCTSTSGTRGRSAKSAEMDECRRNRQRSCSGRANARSMQVARGGNPGAHGRIPSVAGLRAAPS